MKFEIITIVQFKITKYMSEASFAIYIFHYPGIIITAYIFSHLIENQLLKFLTIGIMGFLFCIMIYEVIRRIPVIRFLLGLRKKA